MAAFLYFWRRKQGTLRFARNYFLSARNLNFCNRERWVKPPCNHIHSRNSSSKYQKQHLVFTYMYHLSFTIMKNPDQTSCIDNDMMHIFAVKFSDKYSVLHYLWDIPLHSRGSKLEMILRPNTVDQVQRSLNR